MDKTPHQLPKNPGTHIETINLMQVTLAELSGLGIEEWITNYASDFRILIEKYPNLISNYAIEPEETLHTIRNSLEKPH